MSDESVTTVSSTGMQRSADARHLDFTSIHPLFRIAMARVLAVGAQKYGSKNYERGCDIEDNLQHIHRHLALYEAGDRSENHMAHVGCGAMFSVVNDLLHPELSKPYLRGPGCTLTPEILARQDEGDAERRRKREAGEFAALERWSLRDVPEVKRILLQRADALTPINTTSITDEEAGAILASFSSGLRLVTPEPSTPQCRHCGESCGICEDKDDDDEDDWMDETPFDHDDDEEDQDEIDDDDEDDDDF